MSLCWNPGWNPHWSRMMNAPQCELPFVKWVFSWICQSSWNYMCCKIVNVLQYLFPFTLLLISMLLFNWIVRVILYRHQSGTIIWAAKIRDMDFHLLKRHAVWDVPYFHTTACGWDCGVDDVDDGASCGGASWDAEVTGWDVVGAGWEVEGADCDAVGAGWSRGTQILLGLIVTDLVQS